MTQLKYLYEYDFPYEYKSSIVYKTGNLVEVDVYSTQELKPCEPDQYTKRGLEYHGTDLQAVYIHVEEDTDLIEIEYVVGPRVPFERIRRITGYLVGTLDRFNDAKRAEESERVKHDIR